MIPYLLGFHPSDSVVLLGLRRGRVIFEARGDLSGAVDLADYYAAVVTRQQVTDVMVIGYGPAAAVTPGVLAIDRELTALEINVLDVLRVTGNRYWSYSCRSLDCCPAEGTPFDPVSGPIAAAAVVAGHVALPSRAAVQRRLAPVEGLARSDMRRATARAGRRLGELIAVAADPPTAVFAAGAAAVDGAIDRQRSSGQLDNDEVAWLTVLLCHLVVRDHAWERVDGDLNVHVALWIEVLRRADPELSAAPATLLGFAAWRAGDGVIASMALERALAADPDYALARLLAEAVAGGVPPEAWDAARRGQTTRSGRV
ncbi:hypothetical protein GCM10023322_41680 [Rugosimonospora acidiphila]|uniref:DUF4192 domain-containing protein n=2 Tax=Rugosimonospora acidiphila TaxID=556531 RepID=A0ABP9RZ00_9ACTN